MPFKIVEISGYPPERHVSATEYETRDEAAKSADKSSKTFKRGSGYNQQHDYWWGKDENGDITKILIEAYE